MRKQLPSSPYLNERLDYKPLTGFCIWKTRPREHFRSSRAHSSWNAKHSGDCAGSIFNDPSGIQYLKIKIDGLTYLAHRVIWKMVTFSEPPDFIDHHDGFGLNNKWENLREATEQTNVWNRRTHRNNVLGIKGVRYRTSGHYEVRVQSDGQCIYVGTFNSLEEAISERQRVSRELHGEFASADRVPRLPVVTAFHEGARL